MYAERGYMRANTACMREKQGVCAGIQHICAGTVSVRMVRMVRMAYMAGWPGICVREWAVCAVYAEYMRAICVVYARCLMGRLMGRQ